MPSTVPSPTAVAGLPIEGGTASRATIVDVRVGAHDGYDRLVIEYTGGQPYFRLAAQDPKTFAGPASGKPVTVAGNAGQHLYIFNMDIPPTFQHGMNMSPAYPVLRQVVVMGVFEGQADIAIGLDHQVTPTISLYASPYRLVIDYPTT